jgi:hypothetical protein
MITKVNQQELTPHQKRELKAGVKKTVKQYKTTLRLLSKT